MARAQHMCKRAIVWYAVRGLAGWSGGAFQIMSWVGACRSHWPMNGANDAPATMCTPQLDHAHGFIRQVSHLEIRGLER